MYVYLSKILPLFVMPLGIVLILGLLALLFLRGKKARISTALLTLGLVHLYVMSMPVTGDFLYAKVESRYLPVPLQQVPKAACLVVLGGALEAAAAPRVDIEMSEAVDRVYKAAQLYRAGKTPLIIVTGGRQVWSKDVPSEADLIRELLMEWGVPRDAIILEGSSRNTRENAMYSKFAADSLGCEQALLVTSAAHMPRSVAAFEAVGLSVVPVSTDVRVADTKHLTAMDFLPDARALAMSSDAIRELIGRWVYQMQGWN